MDENFEKLGNHSRQPPLFDGDNFPYWKVRMVAFIQVILGDEAWESIKNGYSHPTKPFAKGSTIKVKKNLSEFTKEEKQESLSNNKGKNCIFMSVNEQEFKRISLCNTSKEAWDTLVSAHKGDERVKAENTQMLVQQYNTLMMDESESFDGFYIKLTTILESGC